MNEVPNAANPEPAPNAGAHRRRGWIAFWVAWTLAAAGAAAWLCLGNGFAVDPVMVVRGGEDPHATLSASLLRHAYLLHLSLYRYYPWVLLAPYVIWLASRFTLERGRWRQTIPVHLAAGTIFALASHALESRIAARQPAQIIVAITETSLAQDPEAARGQATIDHLVRVVRLATNLPSGAALEPKALEAWLAAAGVPRPSSPGQPSAGTGGTAPPGAAVPSESVIRERVESLAPRSLLSPPPPLGRPAALATWLDLFAFGSLLGMGHAVHFYRRVQERERRNLALESHLATARLHALQSQIHPHFLFNTLNSVTALLRQDPRAAEDMLISLSELLRLALNQSARQVIPLREELHFLGLYQEIQATRFGDRLRFAHAIEPAALECPVPSLLLQPLVENAIRHGLEPQAGTGTVRLSARREPRALVLDVEDDGLGCPALVQGQRPLGIGLSNVRERLHSLFGNAARLEFLPGTPRGLRVRVRLPSPAAAPAAQPAPP